MRRETLAVNNAAGREMFCFYAAGYPLLEYRGIRRRVNLMYTCRLSDVVMTLAVSLALLRSSQRATGSAEI